MNYLVKGWNQYFFLLSPNELEQILKDYHMVIFNEQVPMGTFTCMKGSNIKRLIFMNRLWESLQLRCGFILGKIKNFIAQLRMLLIQNIIWVYSCNIRK